MRSPLLARSCLRWAIGALLALCVAGPRDVLAQELEPCAGDDEAGASAAFDAGNSLMVEATTEARARRREHAQELAARALGHFDEQCRLGDSAALAERGAALMLMGEPLRSAQSYDAYLALHPLESLDSRTRRRIEPNLQPGSLAVELVGHSEARLYVNDLDFGPVERAGPIRLPFGEFTVEARAGEEVVASSVVVLSAGSPSSSLLVRGRRGAVETTHEVSSGHGAEHVRDPIPDGPSVRTDYTVWYALTGALTGAFLVTTIGLQLGADERARTNNDLCLVRPAPLGCDAVLAEYDGLFGAYIAGYVLTGIAALGLGTVLILDLTQPSDASSVSLSCSPGGTGIACSGTF